MKTNVLNHVDRKTFEGALAQPLNAYGRLRRTVLACMLWEDTFYESGKTIAERIEDLCKECHADDIAKLAIEAHELYHLRHAPLWLILQLLKKKGGTIPVSTVIEKICTRPDQLTELLALYWKNGRCPLSYQLKKGLAKALTRFDAYQLTKYNRKAKVNLKDVLFMTHAKPKDDAQAAIWKQLADDTLPTPDTWEVRLSAGKDKKESFQDLLEKGKMGKLAILRNLRNMCSTGVDKFLLNRELMKSTRPVLPFQFLSAAKACPEWEDIVDLAMVASCTKLEKLKGVSLVLVDVSGSMDAAISSRSVLTRMDAAAAFAIMLKEICEGFRVMTFSNNLVQIPSRSGMALRDGIFASQPHGGTYLGNALVEILKHPINNKFDRLIVITDEQTADPIPYVAGHKNYIFNVGAHQNGIATNSYGNTHSWTCISGFSEQSIRYIQEIERDKEDVVVLAEDVEECDE